MAATYGGDEVSALVLDVGTAWTKAGYAGEDVPDAYFPSSIGYIPSTSSSSSSSSTTTQLNPEPMSMDVSLNLNSPTSPSSSSSSSWNGTLTETKKQQGNWIMGDAVCSSWQPHMEIKSPLTDGVVSDWEVYEKLWEYTFYNHLRLQPPEHPLLVTEAAWNPKESRKKIMELAFETFDFPAFFLAKNSVMASFAAGRGTSLVVECGAGTTSIVPVYDGYVLNKAIVKQPLAGDHFTWQAVSAYGTHQDGSEIHPPYLIASKKKVNPGELCQVELKHRPHTTSSFHKMAQLRMFNDFKESIFAVSDTPLNPNNPTTFSKPYEFPCGYTKTCHDIYRIPESLFQPEVFYPTSPSPYVGLAKMIHNSLNAVDIDLRPLLLTNVVITGGSSNLPGFTERVGNVIQSLVPGSKIKLYAPTNLSEKKFGAWLGGSILASLGTFHQLWISRKEYNEIGKNIVDMKCV